MHRILTSVLSDRLRAFATIEGVRLRNLEISTRALRNEFLSFSQTRATSCLTRLTVGAECGTLDQACGLIN